MLRKEFSNFIKLRNTHGLLYLKQKKYCISVSSTKEYKRDFREKLRKKMEKENIGEINTANKV